MLKIRHALLVSVSLLAVSCNMAPAPSSVLSGNYYLTGFSSEAERGSKTTNDTDLTGYDLRFEVFPMGPNSNLALSYITREDQEKQNGGSTFSSDAFRAQLMFHYQLDTTWWWWVAPGVNFPLSADSDRAGEEYDGEIFYDFEVGSRVYLDRTWGLQGGLDYSRQKLDGKKKGVKDVRLSGFRAFVGIFVDF
ncbi:MAG: hypothetical protein DWQ01_22695 [Planctomycetota bacterium]|nr:MAG: hypothetical protein DWQ01_22695 [Planctomycetota bacterium]